MFTSKMVKVPNLEEISSHHLHLFYHDQLDHDISYIIVPPSFCPILCNICLDFGNNYHKRSLISNHCWRGNRLLSVLPYL
uniref:CSON012412 protein n=1 Tax=Culicoides sonorensis TaxID=179676 RepID=A0A336MHL0_CULSO